MFLYQYFAEFCSQIGRKTYVRPGPWQQWLEQRGGDCVLGLERVLDAPQELPVPVPYYLITTVKAACSTWPEEITKHFLLFSYI